MGKSKAGSNQKSVKEQGGLDSKTPDPTLVEKLIQKAEELIDSFKYENAKLCYEKALQDSPEHVKALEGYAAVVLELGEIEAAERAFHKAVSVSPEEGHNKYFCLAQLNEGTTSLKFYQKGVELLSHQVSSGANKSLEDEKEMKLDLSNAYCAMAEIYMTDCCDAENAEQSCQEFINKAIEVDPQNPEGFQSLASFQLVKGDLEEAKESAQKSLSFWLPAYLDAREGRETESGNYICPLSFDSRITTSKMLIELELYEEASDILDGLIDENDEVPDVWYLLGWLNYLRGADFYGNARFYFSKMKEVSAQLGDEENEQIQHADEIISILGPETENQVDELSPDSDEWETDEDDEMETA